MKLNLPTAQVFVPDGRTAADALKRITHLGIGAHQDDLEFMASEPIITCFQQPDKWFMGVVMTDGRGSPRSGLYEHYTDEEMRLVRFKEQKKAAMIGEYSAQALLDHPSKSVKDGANKQPVNDVITILKATRPEFVYTHNLADKHDTHIGVALKVIEAIRSLPEKDRPKHLYGCEVWRNLDWMADSDKVIFDVSSHENLQAALMGVFDSQISGGKRYDLATAGRRRAHATYFTSHGTDTATGLAFGMDMTPLIIDVNRDPLTLLQHYVDNFTHEIIDRLKRMEDGKR